jgi:mannosyl-3-phosphoglycerate phosphatase
MMPMSAALPIVVFSCVDDDCLPDPHAVDTAATARALKALERENVSLVLCSSKTRAELELLQRRLEIQHPFICENGAAAFVPRGYFDFDVPGARDVAGYDAVEFGRSYAEVVAALHTTAERSRVAIVGFSDMSVEQVARECQLPILQARLAKLREYEEPFRVLDESAAARPRLLRALKTASLRCVRSGRYDHVGAAVDMSVGVNLLCALYRRTCGPMRTVGLNVAGRDETLLRLLDYQTTTGHETSERHAVPWAQAIVNSVRNLRPR